MPPPARPTLHALPQPPGAGRRADVTARGETMTDERKRSFLRMVSHELRTPLNTVIGFSELLTRELYGPLGAPQYREYAEMIRQSGFKLLKLVNQVLEIARLEGQAVELETSPQALDHALDDAMVQLGEDLAARGATVAVAEDGALPAVMADHKGLRTILYNLLQNAIAFSPEGGTIHVAARRQGEQVKITVRDEGEGVPEEEIPRLIRPFEQGENALIRTCQGAGLGLPICGLLAEAMGGSLRLASPPGQGLTATVTLPAA